MKEGNNRGKTLNFDHDRTYCENTKCQNFIHSLILYLYKGSTFAVECNICRGQLKSQNILGLKVVILLEIPNPGQEFHFDISIEKFLNNVNK